MCNRRNRGFILTRYLLALLITLSILPICVSVFRLCALLPFDYNLVNNELALVDLRRILLLAYDMDVNERELNFIYKNDNYVLRYVNEKLILQPGTQIFLNDINDARFITDEGTIKLIYETNNGEEYTSVIGKEKGIYLNDFLSDNDELSNFDYE